MFKSIALVMVAGLASFTATVASAAKDPLIDTGYQQFASTNCIAGYICNINFPAMTAPVTEITNVSCVAFNAAAGTQLQAAVLYSSNETFAALQSFVFGAATDGTFSFGLVGTTKLFFSAGDNASVQINPYQNSNDFSVQCTISGYTHT